MSDFGMAIASYRFTERMSHFCTTQSHQEGHKKKKGGLAHHNDPEAFTATKFELQPLIKKVEGFYPPGRLAQVDVTYAWKPDCEGLTADSLFLTSVNSISSPYSLVYGQQRAPAKSFHRHSFICYTSAFGRDWWCLGRRTLDPLEEKKKMHARL